MRQTTDGKMSSLGQSYSEQSGRKDHKERIVV